MEANLRLDTSQLLSQEERERNMREFQLLAGTVKGGNRKPSVLTRSRRKMKEDLNIKNCSQELPTTEEHTTRVSKKNGKRKKVLKKLNKAKQEVPVEAFSQFITQQLEEIQEGASGDKQNVVINEDAMKVFHEGLLEVMLKYLENVKATTEANTTTKAMTLEAKRLLGE